MDSASPILDISDTGRAIEKWVRDAQFLQDDGVGLWRVLPCAFRLRLKISKEGKFMARISVALT